MAKKDEYHPKIGFFQVPLGQKLAFFALVITGIVIEILFLYNVHTKRIEDQRKTAYLTGDTIANEISAVLNQYVNTTQILKNFYLQYGDSFVGDEYSEVCQRLIEDNVAIGNLGIAPKGIIQSLYPPPENPDLIYGMNIMEQGDPAGRMNLSLSSKKPVVIGPIMISSGGEPFNALVIDNPIFKDNEFLGFSFVLIDVNDFIKQIAEKIGPFAEGYKIGLWKDKIVDVISDEEGFFYKNEAALESPISKKVNVMIYIPNDIWNLSIDPVVGWNVNQDMGIIIIASIIIFMIFIIISYLKIHSDTLKMYEYQHDSLTGLYTRSTLNRKLRKIFEEEKDTSFDMFFADINHFKVVNRIYGTELCDELLQYIGKKLKELSYKDLCCRFSGDQFLFVVKSEQSLTDEFISNYAKEMVADAPVKHFLLKFGIYRNIDKSETIGLISDKALIAVKSIRNNYDCNIGSFDGPISKQILRQQIIESKFYDALKNGEFKVWFQPKFNSITEELVGAEALVRWWDPSSQTLYSPDKFVPIFENDGLIYHLDRYIFKEVCRLIKTWIDNGEKVVPISVNVSRITMIRPGVVEVYNEDAKNIGVPLKYVPLEITESTTYNTTQIADLGQKFQQYGFLLNMDDFGTGSSSLASLNFMKFDAIKIDKSLVDFIGTADGDELLRHAIDLAHFKKLDVVAEGVENKDQLEFLKKLSCDIIQGYYFSKPRSYEDFCDFKKECEKK